MEWIESRVDQPQLRWELTQCSTIKGMFEIHNLSQLCRGSQNAITLHYNSPTVSDKWVIEIVIRDKSTEWIGVYLKPKPITRLALGRAEFTLKSENSPEPIATYSFDEIREFVPDNFGWGTRQFCRINTIADSEALRANDVLYLDYVIAEYPEGYFSWTLGMRPPLQQLSEIMASMFDDPDTADVCFMINHPHASRTYPRPIYAHSKFLAARCDYFKTLFGSSFSENKESLLSVRLREINWEESEWEQGSDSDYDEPTSDDAEESLNVEETGTYTPLDESLPVGSSTPRSTGGMERRRGAEKARRVVHISDFSYRTFRTVLYFLYTGCIAFAPLTSAYRVAVAQKTIDENLLDRRIYNLQRAIAISPNGEGGNIPWASPKSIYRLADKLGIPELKAAAGQMIKESLTPETVVHELGSTFSSLFSEILKVQEEYAENNWAEVCRTSSFEDLLDRLFQSYPVTQSQIWLRLIKSAIRTGMTSRPTPTS